MLVPRASGGPSVTLAPEGSDVLLARGPNPALWRICLRYQIHRVDVTTQGWISQDNLSHIPNSRTGGSWEEAPCPAPPRAAPPDQLLTSPSTACGVTWVVPAGLEPSPAAPGFPFLSRFAQALPGLVRSLLTPPAQVLPVVRLVRPVLSLSSGLQPLNPGASPGGGGRVLVANTGLSVAFFFPANELQDEKAAKFCFSSSLWEDMGAEEGVGPCDPRGGKGAPLVVPVGWFMTALPLQSPRDLVRHFCGFSREGFPSVPEIQERLDFSPILNCCIRYFSLISSFFFNFSVLERNLFHRHQKETSLVSSTLKIFKSVTVTVLKRESIS